MLYNLQFFIETRIFLLLDARSIYQKLSTALAGDDLQAIYLQRADEIVPNIRYCEYNIGDESAIKDLTDLKLKSTGSGMTENIDVSFKQ